MQSSQPLRLILMGTGPFAVPSFQRILESDDEVVLVVTRPVPPSVGKAKQPINPVLDLAIEYEATVAQPIDINSDDSVAMLQELKPDLLVVCDYGQILSNRTLATARLGGINLHGSLLPRHRGAAPIQWAILAGDRKTGVSVIHMTPKLDGGPILTERVTDIGLQETAGELEQRLCGIGVDAVSESLDLLRNSAGGQALGHPQDPQLATKAPRLKRSDGQIDWSRDADYIARHVRAMQPWPGSYSEVQGDDPQKLTRLIIRKATASRLLETPSLPPGMIAKTDSEWLVACGHGYLQLHVVQPSGKKEMTAAEFLRGHRLQPGHRFLLPQTESPQ